MDNDVKDLVCDFDNLFNAMNICKKNVSWKDSVAGWTKNGLVNINKLERQLKNGEYQISNYTKFTIYEPKERDIVSTRFKDRVFQRSLCDHYLTPILTKSFIYDNGACLAHKGTTFTRNRLSCHMQRYYRKHGCEGYVLKCDITNFFGSTPHNTVKTKIRKLCPDDWVYSEVCRIVDSFATDESPDKGMGLGSQITQLCQLSVLNDIDHAIKERFHIKHYIRYMDDIIIICESKELIYECLHFIEQEFSEIGLTLSRKKTHVFKITQPIYFLGFSFRLTRTGKVVKKVLASSLTHEKHKLIKMHGLVQQGKMRRSHVDLCFGAYMAHVSGRVSDRRKGRPFLYRPNDYFRIFRLQKFYETLWRQQDEENLCET